MPKRLLYLFFGFLVLFVSCKRSLTRTELLEYLNAPDNGLVKEKQINGIHIGLQYKPSDLYVEQHLRAIPDSIRKSELDKLKKQYGENLYLQLSLGKNNREIVSSFVNTSMHSAMVNRLAFGMRDFVVLTTESRDTILLKDYNYVPTYGLSTNNKILFVFENNNLNESEYFKFQLKEMGLETGQVNFKIKIKDINSLPPLKF